MDFETWFKQHVPNAPVGKYHELLAVWEAATEAERERCAKLCEAEKVEADITNDPTDRAYNMALRHAAAAIRAS